MFKFSIMILMFFLYSTLTITQETSTQEVRIINEETLEVAEVPAVGTLYKKKITFAVGPAQRKFKDRFQETSSIIAYSLNETEKKRIDLSPDLESSCKNHPEAVIFISTKERIIECYIPEEEADEETIPVSPLPNWIRLL